MSFIKIILPIVFGLFVFAFLSWFIFSNPIVKPPVAAPVVTMVPKKNSFIKRVPQPIADRGCNEAIFAAIADKSVGAREYKLKACAHNKIVTR